MKTAIARIIAANNATIEDFKSKEEVANSNNMIWNSRCSKHDILQLVLLNEALSECVVQASVDRIDEICASLRDRIEFRLECQAHAFFDVQQELFPA